MSQMYLRQLLDRLNRHQVAFARLTVCTSDEIASAAVAAVGAALEYQTVLLVERNACLTLRASIGLTEQQQARWQQLDRRGACFWQGLNTPSVLQTDQLSPQETQLLARLGLHESVLVVPFLAASSDVAAPDSLLIAAQPLAHHDPALDLGMLELLTFQIGAALIGSAHQMQQRQLVTRAEPENVPDARLAQVGLVVDHLSAVVGQLDPAGRWTLLSQAWTELTGFAVKAGLGTELWHSIDLEDQVRTRLLFGRVIGGCTPRCSEQLRLITSTGEVRWVELSLTQIADAAGRVVGATGLLVDISERRRREQIQAQQQRLFERLATGATLVDVLEPLVRVLELLYPGGRGAVLICDDTGLVKRQGVSAVQSGIYSYTDADGLQGPLGEACAMDWRDDRLAVVSDVLAEPGGSIYQRIAQEHGLRACWAQPFSDSKGKPLGVLAVFYPDPRTPIEAELQRITEAVQLAATAIERMRDHMALCDREELFRLISENTTDHIGVLDDEGKYVYASPSLRRSLGYQSDELIGISAFEHVHPDDLGVSLASWQKVDQEVVQTTFRYRTTHGTWRWFDAIGNAVSYRGARAFISVARDITERRQAEQARQRLEAQLAQAQKMESIGTLAGGIAHDFNNILTAILGNVQLALLGLPAESSEYPLLEEIEKAATRAATLTRQLLTFSRYQQHERKAVDLNATISDLLQMFRRLIGGSVEITIELAPDLPLLVADPVQIEQVVLNLAVNARDAMPEGGQLLIGTRAAVLDESACHDYPWTRPGPYVQIMVCDTGMGMDAETQQRIFEPFFTTKGPGKGTGLGLAVVYGIIKQYDGFITVSSTPGKGSIFTVSLPAHPTVSMPDEASAQPHARGGTETILVVEDEASLRQLATTILERLGYTVLLAEDGLAAVELFSANADRIDLVMLDLIMPRLGGREALARMRTIRPDVLAFFVTGYDSSAERSAAVSTRSTAPILPKPYRLDTLGLTVRQLLDH